MSAANRQVLEMRVELIPAALAALAPVSNSHGRTITASLSSEPRAAAQQRLDIAADPHAL